MGTQNLGHVKGATGETGPAGTNGGIDSVITHAGGVVLSEPTFTGNQLVLVNSATPVNALVQSASAGQIKEGSMVHIVQVGDGTVTVTFDAEASGISSETFTTAKKDAWITVVCVDETIGTQIFRVIGERESA